MEEQPDSVQLDTKADAVRIVDTLKRMPDMVRAKVDFGGEMNIRNSKMARSKRLQQPMQKETVRVRAQKNRSW